MSVLCDVCGRRTAEKVTTDKSRHADGSLRTLVERYQCPCGGEGTYYTHADGTEQVTGCLTTEVTA